MNKKTKKIVATSGVILTLGANVPNVNALQSTQTSNDVQIVIRPGEYPNKPGKRLTGINVDYDINCPIRWDRETGYHIQEYDLNYLISVKIVNYLEQKGVNVVLLETENKSQDLNSAGKRAKQYNSSIYLSVHHNSYNSDSSGYFFMTNEGDSQSSQCAKRLSNAMSSNPMLVPQMENRSNTNGYIGELNQKPAKINILGEFGFALSNSDEAIKCASSEQVDYIARQLGDELIKILNEMNK